MRFWRVVFVCREGRLLFASGRGKFRSSIVSVCGYGVVVDVVGVSGTWIQAV